MNKDPQIHPILWKQALGLAQVKCNEISSQGGYPQDVLKIFGLNNRSRITPDWSKAIELLAVAFCTPCHRRVRQTPLEYRSAPPWRH